MGAGETAQQDETGGESHVRQLRYFPLQHTARAAAVAAGAGHRSRARMRTPRKSLTNAHPAPDPARRTGTGGAAVGGPRRVRVLAGAGRDRQRARAGWRRGSLHPGRRDGPALPRIRRPRPGATEPLAGARLRQFAAEFPFAGTAARRGLPRDHRGCPRLRPFRQAGRTRLRQCRAGTHHRRFCRRPGAGCSIPVFPRGVSAVWRLGQTVPRGDSFGTWG